VKGVPLPKPVLFPSARLHLLRQTIEMRPEVTVRQMSRHLVQLSCADVLVHFAQDVV
jgi:hypothetical protein